jgi:very-short-patch-repair endonuclease
MSNNKIISYNPKLKRLARILRKNSTLGEVLLWVEIKNKSFGYEFHRQVPIKNFIVDFYCHELMLAIEIDGSSHDYKYEDDKARQGILESCGVSVIRFDEYEVRKQMWNVLRVIEGKIKEIEDGDEGRLTSP